ncbi:C2 domain containing protein [Acanthamoeba castellanii str. Neff]|uniref:C2 domain containing protein n=1 Tax=Acanthamoeba castellanii (strain ATCC 30010 / Neff) TaxID=1257118 RepID=L8HDZ3_ACACF|nr:C2 domain containing protein [Acanthamoeba castellanii str. Neff]ELR23415.1 C2 domain containing protein [Acanthamoeba castellanii str. Neff]
MTSGAAVVVDGAAATALADVAADVAAAVGWRPRVDTTTSSSSAGGVPVVQAAPGEMVLASASASKPPTVASVATQEQDVLAAVLSGTFTAIATTITSDDNSGDNNRDSIGSGGYGHSAALATTAVVATSTTHRSGSGSKKLKGKPGSATIDVAADVSSSDDDVVKEEKKEKKKEKKEKKNTSSKRLLSEDSLASSASQSTLSPTAAWTSSSPAVSTARGRKKSGQLGEPQYALDLVVQSAADLVAANRNGLSDPQVRLSGCGQKFKTKYISNTLNPEWHQSFSFTKVQDPEQDRILFDVRDHENIGKSKPLGTAVLELKQLRVGEETPVCLPMMGLAKNDKMQIPATGRLYLSATLRSKEQDENKKRAEEPNEGGAVPAPTSKRADERVVETTTSATGSGSTAALGSGPVPAPRSSEEPRPAPVQPISGPPSLGGVGEPHKKPPSPPSTPRSAPPSAEGVDLADLDDGLDTVVTEDEASGVSKEAILRQEGPLQIRTLKVWKERWFSLADDGHLVYWKNQKKKKLLGMIDFRGCEVRVRIATHKSVEKAKKMANGKSAEKANKKLRFAFEIVQPANKPIFLRETPSGAQLKSYKAHGRTHRCLLRAGSKMAMDDWFYAINYSAHSLQTSEGLFSIPASAKMVPVPYLSILIARHFEDMRTSSIMRHVLMKKLGGKLSAVRRPPALGPLVLEDFDLGQSMKDIFKGMRACTTDIPNEMLGEIDINYSNGVSLRVSTFLTKGIVQIPLVVVINIHLLAGKLKVYCPADVSAKWWACFNRLPELNVGITLYIDGRKLPVSSLPKLRHWVFHAIQNMVRDRLVWPARLKFRFPFPGQRIDMEIVYAVVRPPTAPAPVVPVEMNEVVARRYLATRYFEEIINRRQIHLIEELFTADCVVHGGLAANGEAALGPLHGVEGVYTHVSALLTAFPRVRFICESVSVEGQYHAIVRWKARATNDGPFLGHTPLGEEVILHGVTVNVIRYGNQRIAVQHHYFDAEAVVNLLSTNRAPATLPAQPS